MRTCYLAIVLLSFFAVGSANPIRSETPETVTDGLRPSTQETTTTSLPDEDSVVDVRLTRSQASQIGYYGCKDDSQCINGGKCAKVGEPGSICNCTKGYLGPFCAYPSLEIRDVVRKQPQFKVLFMECLKKSGESSNINTLHILDKCGSTQNLCWFEKGGVKAVKDFFWCLTNSMRLSLTEEKPSGESRAQMLSFFEKLERERQLPPGQPQTRPQAVPVASIQINIYNLPRPQEDTRPNGPRKPTITIKPGWTYWTTQRANEESKAPSQEPVAVDQPGNPSDESTRNSSSLSTPTPTSPTVKTSIPEISSSTVGNVSSPSNEADTLDYVDDDDYPSLYSFVGNTDLTFLGNVVEDTSEDYDEVLFDMVPYVNTSSNMRG